MKQANLVATIYIILIVTGAFLDMSILAILAFPGFFIFSIFFLMALFNLPVHQERREWLSSTLLVIGTLLLVATIFYTAIDTTQYLIAVSRNVTERFFPTPLLTVSKLIGISFFSSFFLIWGIKERTRWPLRIIISVGFAFFLAAPLTATVVKILELMGSPLTD